MKQEKNKFVLTQDDFDTILEQESRKEVLDMQDKEYVEQLISDMQDAEGRLFTKEMLQQRMSYIKTCMNNVNVTLSEEEILDLL